MPVQYCFSFMLKSVTQSYSSTYNKLIQGDIVFVSLAGLIFFLKSYYLIFHSLIQDMINIVLMF